MNFPNADAPHPPRAAEPVVSVVVPVYRSGEQLRALLAVIVLAVAIRLLFDLLLTPSELYSIVSARGA